MKKLVLLFIMFFSLNAFAQNDVTKFLGIPVDGTKENMIKQIETKGFKYNKNLDCLEGEFNGHDVYIMVLTIRNKVYRVAVEQKNPIDEAQIKIRYNKLCNQFSNSPKYVAVYGNDYTIPESEDISYEITVHKKSYQAAFLQIPDPDRKKWVWFTIQKDGYDKYSIWMYYDNTVNQNTDDDI